MDAPLITRFPVVMYGCEMPLSKDRGIYVMLCPCSKAAQLNLIMPDIAFLERDNSACPQANKNTAAIRLESQSLAHSRELIGSTYEEANIGLGPVP